jgi:hypothetical protein
MMNFKKLALLGAVLVSANGCAYAAGGNGVALGGLYSGYQMGGQVGAGTGTKTGEACAMSILGAVALGDASLSAAKTAGGITKVAHVDHDNMGVLGIYAETCTIVVGD